MMTVHDFAFVLDADPHCDETEALFFEPQFEDSTLVLQNGALALSFDREGDSYKDAVLSAYQDIRNAGVGIISFDPDYLVTSIEISRRVRLSRSAISKYERSDIDNGFPTPIRLVSTKRPFYDWVAVSKWFFSKGVLAEEEYHHAVVSRIMNIGAQARGVVDIPLSLPDLMDKALEDA